jgi:Tfp pilus assembly protein PilF
MLAQLYVQQGRLDEARAEFEGLAKRDPSNVGAQTMVGMLLESQGRRDDAVKSYEGTLRGNANAPVAANNLAFIYAERGQNLDQALELATAAKQRMPEDANVDDTLGWIYVKRRQPQQAIPYLQDSLKRRPDVPEVLYHLGVAYAAAGDKARARETLERALKLDPKIGGDDARRTLASVSE